MMKNVLRTMLSVMMMMVCTMLFAQTDDDQLLVFRKSGEINMFFQSEIDSITTTSIDKEGVEHEVPIAQLFHTADTTLYVNIEEIDSVCIGNRNQIVFHSDVRQIADDDMQWIIRTEGNIIYYKLSTPANILPFVGQKLFYGYRSELFPQGLTAKVVSVVKGSSEIAVSLEDVSLTDIFIRYVYTGILNDEQTQSSKRRALNIDGELSVNREIEVGDNARVSVDGSVSVSGPVVANIGFGKIYLNGKFDIDSSFGFNVAAMSKESRTIEYESPALVEKDFMPLYGVLFPSASLNAFYDARAELRFDYSMHRFYKQHVDWTFRNGENTVMVTNRNNNDQGHDDEANIALMLDGYMFFGPELVLDLLVAKEGGARIKAKFGPVLSGNVSAGVLQNLQNAYDSHAYGSASISNCGRLAVESYLLFRKNILWGEIEEGLKLFDANLDFARGTINLFPEYENTRATAPVANKKEAPVSVAAKTKTPIIYELETGFQVVNNQDDVIAEEFTGTIEAKREDTQVYSTELIVDDTDFEELAVRPVFHYGEFTIPFASTSIAQNPNIQPVICFGTNGAVTYVSGVPIVDIAQVDSTTYHIGPFLPVAVYDKDFHDKSPYVCYDVVPIKTNNLIGTWECEMNDTTKVQLTFNTDMTSSLKENEMPEQNGEYSLNTPQSGYVTMTFDDNPESIVFVLDSIDNQEMKVRFRKHYSQDELYVFRKQEE